MENNKTNMFYWYVVLSQLKYKVLEDLGIHKFWCHICFHCLNILNMSKFWILFLIIPVILSGPNDTLDQLRAVITNVPYDEQAQGK